MTPRIGVLTAFSSAILVSRIALVLLLFSLTGGHEVSNDSRMHMIFVRDPLSVVRADPGFGQYPHLLPFIESGLGYLLQLSLVDFLALRLDFVCYEVLLGALFYLLTNRLAISDRRRRVCLLAFFIPPLGWMTSSIMAQDEVIAGVFTILPFLLFLGGRQITALFVCSVGIVAAKLFLVFPLLIFLLLCRRGSPALRLAAALGPVLIVYSALAAYRLMNGLQLPLVAFSPDPYAGTNFWVLLKSQMHMDLVRNRIPLEILAVAFGLAPIYLIVRARGKVFAPLTSVYAVLGSLLLFFSVFYHMQPEYFIMVVPLLIVTASSKPEWLGCIAVATLPWLTKFFQNANFMMMADINSGKKVALRYYTLVFGASSPATWWDASIVLLSIVTVLLGFTTLARLHATLTSGSEDDKLDINPQ